MPEEYLRKCKLLRSHENVERSIEWYEVLVRISIVREELTVDMTFELPKAEWRYNTSKSFCT